MDDPPEEKSRRAGVIAVAITAALILYPLSIGPAYVMVLRNRSIEPVYSAAYAPMIWLCKHVPFVEKATVRYIMRWTGPLPWH